MLIEKYVSIMIDEENPQHSKYREPICLKEL
jgi:hypothetical protein